MRRCLARVRMCDWLCSMSMRYAVLAGAGVKSFTSRVLSHAPSLGCSWRMAVASHDMSCLYCILPRRRLGCLWLASTREQYEHALRSYPPAPADVTRTPASGGVLDAAALCALEPALSRALHGAVLFPGCATANPREVMLAALADAREAGVRVLEGTAVEAVDARAAGPGATEFTINTGACAVALRVRSGCALPDVATVALQRVGFVQTPGARDPLRSDVSTSYDTLVIAAGGLTPHVASLLPGAAPPPVVPVLGQMWGTARADGTAPRTRHLLCGMESELAWEVRGASARMCRGTVVVPSSDLWFQYGTVAYTYGRVRGCLAIAPFIVHGRVRVWAAQLTTCPLAVGAADATAARHARAHRPRRELVAAHDAPPVRQAVRRRLLHLWRCGGWLSARELVVSRRWSPISRRR